jgi:hypothetical protein
MFVLPLAALALAAGFPASGQSVVSTHSGVIYFFVGSAFLGDERLEQKFGRFPDMGEGRELHTTLGRAEVLLTPGVFLRIDENSSIRMLSSRFSDTRVELLGGSAILEVTETVPDTAVKLIYKNWQMRVPQKGAYRIDTEPPQVRSYQGEVEVAADGRTETVTVREGEVLPLAAVLVAEPPTTFGNDDFKHWGISRSQAISADNTIAAGIVDDPSQTDNSGLASGGFSYFPFNGIPSPDIGTPYGLSFWSPYQSTWSSIYFSSYLYGPLYLGWPNGRWLYTGRTLFTSPVGTHVPRTAPPRIPVPSPRPATPLSPHPAVHAVSPLKSTSSLPNRWLLGRGVVAEPPVHFEIWYARWLVHFHFDSAVLPISCPVLW